MMTFHLLNLNQQLTTLLIASIIFKQIIVNSFKNIYQIYAYIYKSLKHLQNIQISTRSFKKKAPVGEVCSFTDMQRSKNWTLTAVHFCTVSYVF